MDSGNLHVKYNCIEAHIANISKQTAGKSLLILAICIGKIIQNNNEYHNPPFQQKQ